MSTALKKIQELILYQEQNMSSSSNTVSIADFETIDTLIEESLSDLEEKNKVLEFCEQQIVNNKHSIFALYITGICSLQENTLNDDNILKLLEYFTEAKKWGIVEYIAHKTLQFRNNLHALRHLSLVYEAKEEQDKLINIWEQIVRIDYEESDMLYKLANYKKEHGNIDAAIKDYKKAIQRYLQQKNFSLIKEIWNILIEHQPLNIDFYLSFIDKVEKIVSQSKSEELLQALYHQLKDTDNYDIIITILKTLLRIDGENEDTREYLIEVYRKKHAENPKLEDFIRMSNLTQSWRNTQEAISDFEKHIAFFPGSFVFHSKWGIGRINTTDHQELVIDFAKKRSHKMEISMAVNSLESLPKNHFWVLKTILPKEKLKEKILQNPIWTLKKIITSLDGADVKAIKSELVPSILKQSEWNTWSIKIRKILQENPYFSIKHDKSDLYVFSETPITTLDKFYNIFRQEDNFITKIKHLRKVLDAKIFDNDTVENDDIFLSIVDYFSSYVNKVIAHTNEYNEEFINSLFICDEISNVLPSTKYHIHIHMPEFIPTISIDTAKQIIKQLKINAYKDTFLVYIKLYRPDDWRELYISLLPYYHTSNIIESLETDEEIDLLKNVFIFIQNNINDFKAAYIWFATILYEKAWVNEVSNKFKIICDLLRTAILLYRDIQNKYQVPVHKKLFHTIDIFLFESGKIDELISTETEKNISYFYSLVKQISELIPNRILHLRDTIVHYIPNFDFHDQFDFEQSGSTGFLTLSESLDERKKTLQHIHEFDVPANSKEIEKARAYGDLKENAEYKAALEHQEYLNNRVAQLKKEIEQARIFDEKNLSTNNVGFGTKIELLDLKNNTHKTYTILGPWESNPDEDIISYLSPLGQYLYKKKLDEKIEFNINDKPYSVSITSIKTAI